MYIPVILTWNEHIPVFPLLSVALHLTTVVPIEKSYPDDGWHVTLGTIPELSVAPGPVHITIAVSSSGLVRPVIFWQALMNFGASRSTIQSEDNNLVILSFTALTFSNTGQCENSLL